MRRHIPTPHFVVGIPNPLRHKTDCRCSFEEAVISFSGFCYSSSQGAMWPRHRQEEGWVPHRELRLSAQQGRRCTSQEDTGQKQTPSPTGKELQDPAENQRDQPFTYAYRQRDCDVSKFNELVQKSLHKIYLIHKTTLCSHTSYLM